MMKALLMLSCVLAIGAAPKPAATKPAYVDGYKGIVAAIPKGMLPPKEKEQWTALQQKAIADWLDREFNGQTIRLAGKVDEVTPETKGRKRIVVTLKRTPYPPPKINGRGTSGDAAITFEADAADALAKYDVDAPITVEARILRVHIEPFPAGEEMGLTVTVWADRATIVK